MARRTRRQAKRPIESYDHRGEERLNNPPVGLVTPDTDRDAGKKTYEYDPHLDPQLQWAGKAEHTSFEVPTVSLHVHERIDPLTIVEAVRKRNGNGGPTQGSLFELPEENPPVRDAIDFYKHRHNWTNRLVSGDSLLVMNSLLEKEGMAGKVQMVYIDPPYGIRYGSNFQPFVDKRDVRDGRDEDLAQEPETIKAFRDTWELGIHSYLSYLRDRLLLAREMLTESGSCFVQISDENVHLVRSLMDDVFGKDEFVATIDYRVFGIRAGKFLDNVTDNIIWYGKDREKTKYRQLFHIEKRVSDDFEPVRLYRPGYSEGLHFDLGFEGKVYQPPSNMHWATGRNGLNKLKVADRLIGFRADVRYKRRADDFPYRVLTTSWQDTWGEQEKQYAVQTSSSVIQRCLLMTTDPGDLVFDPTCGSGTTAYVAEQWGRRWITCDTSRVAVTLTQQRLMTALYDYYELAHPEEGVGSGFNYKTVPHVTLRSIANNPDIREGMTQEEIDAAIARHAPQETLYDQPLVDRRKKRVTGPFSVEAVPAPVVDSGEGIVDSGEGEESGEGIVDSGEGEESGEWIVDSGEGEESGEWIVDSGEGEPSATHHSLSTTHYPLSTTFSRSGETLRQADWRDELMKTGIRGRAGQYIRFARLEPLPGAPGLRNLHADGETLPNDAGRDVIREGAASAAQRVVVSFGPEHAPLEQRQVEAAIEEAQTLVPRPRVIVFAAFQFDPEAAKDIDETKWGGVTLLKAQMNADLLTDDLKKKRASNESFWLIGQPDVVVDSEEWIVNSRGEALAPYEVVAKLSGVDGLAESDGVGRDGLSTVIAITERRDLWDALAADEGGGVDSGEHSGGPGAARHGGVPALPGSGARLPGRIGDAADLVRQLGALAREGLDDRVESLRRDRQIVDRAREIAASLTSPLSTTHYSQVTVRGFDYYNTKSGNVESGGEDRIAMWMVDTDYDGRSLYPRQVFFPMAGPKDGWDRLSRNLRAEIDDDLIEAYRGTVSLPFEAGEHGRIAVKIVDDRGIESLRVVDIEPSRPKRSIEEILKHQARQVPPEEWSKLPSDLIERLDYYTSGADV